MEQRSEKLSFSNEIYDNKISLMRREIKIFTLNLKLLSYLPYVRRYPDLMKIDPKKCFICSH